MKTEKSNMYELSVQQWSPFKGCGFDCTYCKPSFQAQSKRQRKHCDKCYTYEPHYHPERLDDTLANTGYMQFIFTCSSGDVSYCSTKYLTKIVERISSEPYKTFLIQSKNPATFNRVKFPANVILGTTIETNRDDLYAAQAVSKASLPSQRYEEFLKVDHPQKMVTVEPVMDFDLDVMVGWLDQLRPVMAWLGYDSKRSNLPEPALQKVKDLHWALSSKGIVVVLKTIREGRSE